MKESYSRYTYYPDIPKDAKCCFCQGGNLEGLIRVNYPVRLENDLLGYKEIVDAACSDCGLVQRHPMPSPDQLMAFYSGQQDIKFILTTENKYEGDYLIENIKKDQFYYLFNKLELQERINIRNICEIGVFEGAFLSIAQRNGYIVGGFEPSEHAEIASSNLGVKIKKEFFGKDSLFSIDPDIVAILHVLEHVSDPVIFLETVINVVKKTSTKNPYFFIEVPNLLGFSSNDLGPFSNLEHTYNFTKNSLIRVLRKSGLAVLHCDVYSDRPIIRCICQFNYNSSCNYQNIDELISEDLKKIKDLLDEHQANLLTLDIKIKGILAWIKSSSKRLIIHAAGIHTIRLLDRYPELLPHVDSIVDADSQLWGKSIKGILIAEPNPLGYQGRGCLISSYAYQNNIFHYVNTNYKPVKIFNLYDNVISHENFINK